MDQDQAAAGQEQDTQDEFEAAFAQAGQELRTKTVDAPQATIVETEGASQAADAPAADAPTQGTADEQDAKAAASTAAAKPAQGQRSYQELESLLTDALHRERSNAQRISSVDLRSNGLARENEALKRQVSDFQTQLRNKGVVKVEPGQNVDDVLANAPELQSAVMRRIQEATAPLRDALDAANTKLGEVGEATVKAAEAIRPVVARDEMAAVREVWTGLDGEFTPAWRNDIKTADFRLWLKDQSAAIQGLYDNSVTIKETADVLELYYARRGGRPKAGAEQQPGNNLTAKPNTAAQKAAGSNERLRQASGIAPRPGAATKHVDSDDFEGAFAEATGAMRAAKKG